MCDNRVKGGKMEKIIIIVLVSLVIILVINLYEAYRIIQILFDKVRDLSRERFELKNKEKSQIYKKEEIDEREYEEGYTYFFSGNELYFKLKNTEKEKGNRYT